MCNQHWFTFMSIDSIYESLLQQSHSIMVSLTYLICKIANMVMLGVLQRVSDVGPEFGPIAICLFPETGYAFERFVLSKKCAPTTFVWKGVTYTSVIAL